MTPKIQEIDHVHIFVKNRELSEIWYREVLGLSRVAGFEFWASNGGPLTIANEENSMHLALFESEKNQRTVIAFSTSGREYIKWFSHLKSKGFLVAHNDHEISWSIYFKDPDGNPYEITTYEYEFVKIEIGLN